MYVSLWDCVTMVNIQNVTAFNEAENAFTPQYAPKPNKDPNAPVEMVAMNRPPTFAKDGFEVHLVNRPTGILFVIVSESRWVREDFVSMLDRADLAHHFKLISSVKEIDIPGPRTATAPLGIAEGFSSPQPTKATETVGGKRK